MWESLLSLHSFSILHMQEQVLYQAGEQIINFWLGKINFMGVFLPITPIKFNLSRFQIAPSEVGQPDETSSHLSKQKMTHARNGGKAQIYDLAVTSLNLSLFIFPSLSFYQFMVNRLVPILVRANCYIFQFFFTFLQPLRLIFIPTLKNRYGHNFCKFVTI